MTGIGDKDCDTCKFLLYDMDEHPCNWCYNGEKWEAQDTITTLDLEQIDEAEAQRIYPNNIQ